MAEEDRDVGSPRSGVTGPHPAPHSAGGPTSGGAVTYRCDLCGAIMLDLHCKLVCERCGYKRDCSDP